MKIYQVFESYPLFYQPYIPPTLEALAKQKDIHSKIIAFRGKSDERDVEVLPSYKKRRIIEHFYQLLRRQKQKLNLLEIKALKEEVDIIHIQHSYLFGKILSILELPRNKRPKIIITLRGGDTYVKPWVSKRWQEFYNDYGSRVDAFVVMSENQKKYLHRWKVPSEKIHVIPISFGKTFEIQPKFPNNETLKIVSIFRMCWEKNIPDNLKLIKQLVEYGIQVEYDVYGSGSDIGQLYYLVDRYKLNEFVAIKGKAKNNILKENLSNYDFILQLSHSESLGMSIIEAQTYGVLPIVSNADGLVEIVKNNVTGLVLKRDFKPKKEVMRIIDLWRDKFLYKKMSSNAIEFSQTSFNTDIEVRKLTELYTKLIS